MPEEDPVSPMTDLEDRAGGFAAQRQQSIHNSCSSHVYIASCKSTLSKLDFDSQASGAQTPISNGIRASRSTIDLYHYFVGPRDMDKHSKLPYFMRMHGSVLPRMIVPISLIASWATLITCISKFVHELSVNTLLLTVLGFVVALSLSFRSTTAYERYSEGRKSWATLSVQCRNLARCIWVHVEERPGEQGKDDLLSKLTAMNLLLAFAVALKHKLRFEPYAHYEDICSLVGHLDTFAKAAYTPEIGYETKKTPWKAIGEHIGMSLASSNPRKAVKRATRPLGNLPMEILTYLSCYVHEVSAEGPNQTLKSSIVLGQIMIYLAALTDTQASAERVLTTPLPIGYNILISQIVLLYTYLLPFQLYGALGWITIPGTIAAAYIIIGLAAIGNELENPFGNDVNDLPLDQYCAELGRELDIITSSEAPKFSDLVKDLGKDNKPLWPLSKSGPAFWRERDIGDIRSALKSKVVASRAVSFSDKSGAKPRSKSWDNHSRLTGTTV